MSRLVDGLLRERGTVRSVRLVADDDKLQAGVCSGNVVDCLLLGQSSCPPQSYSSQPQVGSKHEPHDAQPPPPLRTSTCTPSFRIRHVMDVTHPKDQLQTPIDKARPSSTACVRRLRSSPSGPLELSPMLGTVISHISLLQVAHHCHPIPPTFLSFPFLFSSFLSATLFFLCA